MMLLFIYFLLSPLSTFLFCCCYQLIALRSRRFRKRGLARAVVSTSQARNPVCVGISRSILRDNQSTFLDVGNPTNICSHCGALFWDQEKCKEKSRKNNPKYTLCCRYGRVSLPSLQTPPPVLSNLLDITNGLDLMHFVESIRMYNPMFGFTSMGVEVDNSINDGRSPYVFKISGQACHLMGSLLPPEGQTPRFAQLYMYDTTDEELMRTFCIGANKLIKIISKSTTKPQVHGVSVVVFKMSIPQGHDTFDFAN